MVNWELRNPERRVFNRAKERARKWSLPFDIDLVDIVIPNTCPILGIELKIHKGDGPGYFPDSPSLDRIVPARGYVKGNVRVISNKANMLKSDASLEELRLILRDLEEIHARSV